MGIWIKEPGATFAYSLLDGFVGRVGMPSFQGRQFQFGVLELT
jgi:hypothetical protein